MIYFNQLRQEISQHSLFTHEVLLKYTYQQSTTSDVITKSCRLTPSSMRKIKKIIRFIL